MKKILLTTICICFIAVLIQNTAHAFELGLGPKIGLGSGFYTGDDWNNILNAASSDNSAVFSFSTGLLVDMNFYQGDVFGIGMQPEILYTSTGGGYKALILDIEFSQNCLQIPLYIKPRFSVGKGHLYLLAGPDILLSLDSEIKANIGGSTDVDKVYSIGMGAGIGYDLPLGPGKLGLSITYSTYFTGFGDGTNWAEKINNNIVHFNASYAFMVVK